MLILTPALLLFFFSDSRAPFAFVKIAFLVLGQRLATSAPEAEQDFDALAERKTVLLTLFHLAPLVSGPFDNRTHRNGTANAFRLSDM
jgi:hypothetical protein